MSVNGSESRKNNWDGIRLNPKCYNNGQSAAKHESEGSTTIPREGSTFKRMEVVSPKLYICTIWIRYSLCLHESVGCT